MKCSIHGCPGDYEHREIVHTVRRGEKVLVFEHVPAEVCNVCSDTLLAPETTRHIDRLLHQSPKPERFAPLYEYV